MASKALEKSLCEAMTKVKNWPCKGKSPLGKHLFRHKEGRDQKYNTLSYLFSLGGESPLKKSLHFSLANNIYQFQVEMEKAYG